MTRIVLQAAAAVVLLAANALAAPPSAYEAFEAARKLQQAGEEEKAFLAYLAIPGAQHVAVQIARPEAQKYLPLLEHAQGVSLPLAKVVEGDLRLALGQKDKALACYRAAAACAADKPDQGYASGHIPQDAYLVEPPSTPETQPFFGRPVEPFAVGPGSHRDNWLIRRFIALEAWDDAAAEFARVWQIHRRNARPYRASLPVWKAGKAVGEEERLVEPSGFDSRGLQFALDYAFFLKKRDEPDKALAVLREPLLAIDMDRNPNSVAARPIPQGTEVGDIPLRPHVGLGATRMYLWTTAGVSRKEFIRLAYGAFKGAGKEEEVVRILRDQIEANQNRLRRVLAQVRYHQGRIDDALALELAYIDRAGFGELTAAYRRGRVYEDASKPAEAIAAYERALELAYTPPVLPDADEEAVQAGMMRQMAAAQPAPGSEAGKARFLAEVIGRLQRLYGAMGKPEKVFELTLRQFEVNPMLLGNVEMLAQTRIRAEALGRGEEFEPWLRRELAAVEEPVVRANIFWVLKDYPECARAIVRSWKGNADSARYGFTGWCEKFRREGKGPLRTFLSTVVEQDPNNARARLELLNLQEPFEGPAVIEALEALLETGADFAFARGKGDYNRTKFRSYFDLAYRLMRLYEKAGRIGDLQKLGLRIAAGEKPFGKWWEADASQHQYRNQNGLPEDINACLALLVQRADGATLARLQALWKEREDFPAKRQLARRLAGTLRVEQPGDDVGWANVPKGARAIVSAENVLALACDDKYVYAGHPWGVAVYDLDGKPVTRIALGEAARALAAGGDFLWAGTPKGLFRIGRDDWAVAHLWLHGDVPERDRYARSFPGSGDYWFDNGVYTLAMNGRQLWIGLHRNVQRLDTRTMTLRAYSYHELGLENWAGFYGIVPDGEYVWAVGSAGLRRYDRKADTWQKVEFGEKGVGLIGIIDGRLFGHVWLNDQLRNRPCLIDRKTLEVTPILIEGKLSDRERMIGGPFCYFGTYRGKLAFGDGGPGFVLDEGIMKLRPIGAPWDRPDDPIQSLVPRELRSGVLFWSGDPVEWQRGKADRGVLAVRELDGSYWSMLALPDGRTIVGRRNNRIRYQYPNEDWPSSDIVWDKKEAEGGLWFVDADGVGRRVSAEVRADAIPGDAVFDAVSREDSSEVWLCTDLGLSVLDERDRVVARFTRSDGLCANRVTSGAAVGDRLFFSTAWGDHGGGLVVADPETAVLSAYYQSDGLATDKLARIEKLDGTLRLVYDVEYGRGGSYDYRLFSPGTFDAETGRFHSVRVPRYVQQNEANAIIAKRAGKPQGLTPYLGGYLIATRRIGDKTYLCGTRGLVVQPADGPAEVPPVEELAAQVVTDPFVKLKAEADNTPIQVADPEGFIRLVTDANPFVRARVLQMGQYWMTKAPGVVVPVLKTLVHDPYTPNRRVVTRLLGQSGDASAVKLLKPALEDPDKGVRRNAAVALASLGAPPPLAVFEKILSHGGRGHDSYLVLDVFRALAPRADRAVFELLLKYPLVADDYDGRQAVFEDLGGSLRRSPECADLLLSAYMKDDPGPQSNYGAPRFAQEVFKHAGKAMLPRLHQALESDDRVVRSNAARACGAIGDRASISWLIEALDLESGLSRASIVWALGELKAEEALSELASLYVDARNDEKRRAGAGFRMAQAAAQMQSQYETLSSLDTIAADWDELSRVAAPEPIDPRRDEPLLKPQTILEAVRKIGPECSQEFYRKLAAEADSEARQEAAERLAEGTPADAETNLPILRNLLADRDVRVRMGAAVSLLILGQEDVQKQILVWLGSGDRWQPYQMALCLERVQDGRKLTFARGPLQRLLKSPDVNSYQRSHLRNLVARIP